MAPTRTARRRSAARPAPTRKVPSRAASFPVKAKTAAFVTPKPPPQKSRSTGAVVVAKAKKAQKGKAKAVKTKPTPKVLKGVLLKADDQAIVKCKLESLRGKTQAQIAESAGLSVTSVRRFLNLLKPDPRQSEASQQRLIEKHEQLHKLAEEQFVAEGGEVPADDDQEQEEEVAGEAEAVEGALMAEEAQEN